MHPAKRNNQLTADWSGFEGACSIRPPTMRAVVYPKPTYAPARMDSMTSLYQLNLAFSHPAQAQAWGRWTTCCCAACFCSCPGMYLCQAKHAPHHPLRFSTWAVRVGRGPEALH